MKLIFQQAFKSLTSQKLMAVFIVLMMSLGLFLVIGCVGYYEQNDTKLSNFYKAYAEDEYRYYVETIPFGGNNSDEYIAGLRAFYRKMIGSTDFKAYVFSTNNNVSLCVGNYTGPDKCLRGYDFYQPSRDVYVNTDTGVAYSELNTYMISPGLFEQLSLNVAEGTDFADYDCKWSKGETIPVVLGWDFKKTYELGDLLDCRMKGYTNAYAQYEVVGFLPPDAAVLKINDSSSEDGVTALSSAALIPAVDLMDEAFTPYTENKQDYWARSYYLHDEATFLVISDHAISSFSEYDESGVIGDVASARVMRLSSSFITSANEYFNMLILASALIIVGSTVCLALNMVNKLLANFKTYAVHQISGGTLGTVSGFMIAETAMLMLLSNIIAFVCALAFGSKVFTYSKAGLFGIEVTRISPMAALAAVAVTLLVSAASLLYPLLKLRATEFDTLLRGRE